MIQSNLLVDSLDAKFPVGNNPYGDSFLSRPVERDVGVDRRDVCQNRYFFIGSFIRIHSVSDREVNNTEIHNGYTFSCLGFKFVEGTAATGHITACPPLYSCSSVVVSQ